MLNKLFIIIFIMVLFLPNNANSQDSSSVEVLCVELFQDILLFYNNLESIMEENDWITKKIQKTNDSIFYNFLIGNLEDTLITVKIVTVGEYIYKLIQLTGNKVVGLSIYGDSIISKNPYGWETFRSITNTLIISDKNPHILFAIMLRSDYVDYHKIKCVTERELIDKLLREEK